MNFTLFCQPQVKVVLVCQNEMYEHAKSSRFERVGIQYGPHIVPCSLPCSGIYFMLILMERIFSVSIYLGVSMQIHQVYFNKIFLHAKTIVKQLGIFWALWMIFILIAAMRIVLLGLEAFLLTYPVPHQIWKYLRQTLDIEEII